MHQENVRRVEGDKQHNTGMQKQRVKRYHIRSDQHAGMFADQSTEQSDITRSTLRWKICATIGGTISRTITFLINVPPHPLLLLRLKKWQEKRVSQTILLADIFVGRGLALDCDV